MNCRDARERLAGFDSGRLPEDERAALARHLDGCADCRRAAEAEAALNTALDRLPRHAAPGPLKRRLEALLDVPAAAPAVTAPPARTAGSGRWRSTWLPPLVSAFAAAALVLIVMRSTAPRPADSGASALLDEAVNDHLRVVSSTHPVDIESGGIHQVKPWFTGRLDFAPRVAFGGDDDFPLVGGSVGYVHDRKAAVFVFKRRLHTITLLVFPAEGFDWPRAGQRTLGRLAVTEQATRGFSTLLWRDGDLGYALVSDVNSHELELLASRL